MTKTFTIDNTEYTVTTCTAIAVTAGDTDRQDALLIESTADSGEMFRFVAFGYDMPETVEDFQDMADDSSAWDSDSDTLATVQERKVYFMPDAEHHDTWFWSDRPVCLSYDTIVDLANGWSKTAEELMEQVHKATADEIKEWGVYNG
jgi:hypothetical protein